MYRDLHQLTPRGWCSATSVMIMLNKCLNSLRSYSYTVVVSAEENRTLDVLVLVTIGIITLLAAVSSLYIALSGGEASTQPKTTTTGTAAQSTQPETAPKTSAAPEKTAPATVAPVGWVSAIGDSVMIGAVDALQQEIPSLALIEAQGIRQPSSTIDILRQRRAAGQLGDVVIVHVGNNGPFTAEQFEEMMQVLAGVRKVLIVNLSVPPEVEDPIAVVNNAVLASGVQRHPNTVLVDWRTASVNHPEFLGEDGLHLTLEGVQAYAHLIATHLQDAEASTTPPGPPERVSWGEGGSFGECVGPSSWCPGPVTPQ
jgi:hydrogenase maturation factor